jgi:hypothetical protein
MALVHQVSLESNARRGATAKNGSRGKTQIINGLASGHDVHLSPGTYINFTHSAKRVASEFHDVIQVER